MNVVDASAIVAVLQGEPGSGEIERKLADSPCVMSAATRVELGIVIEAKAGPTGTQLLEELLVRTGMEVATKGRHRSGLNFGGIFAYALARRMGQLLLFVGDDFSYTDVEVA